MQPVESSHGSRAELENGSLCSGPGGCIFMSLSEEWRLVCVVVQLKKLLERLTYLI